ncbi:hypothetical protein AVEN_221677-1 [Araneus ventricosus]|uniref:Uncharacterized protein n=1 Tax=Araneus ventricosus TaxID=182803 RepID=A0A4Y2VR09_ARAVE|nr:hypothetical protein AVEN_10264-1 [Araneus ventricosus]GBO27776.1 hypothetical protein AVEN_221677-1 [Araneus ventricosus]
MDRRELSAPKNEGRRGGLASPYMPSRCLLPSNKCNSRIESSSASWAQDAIKDTETLSKVGKREMKAPWKKRRGMAPVAERIVLKHYKLSGIHIDSLWGERYRSVQEK